MDRSFLANTILSFLIVITAVVLWINGEKRIDAYISLYTLEYIIIKVTLRPKKIIRDFIAIILIVSFIFFISIRIAEVLGIRILKLLP
jgi:signal transduction histidine kinase